MHYTTCKQESENTASGSAVSRTRSQTPSPGTTTARTTNSPTFSAHTAPPRFLLFRDCSASQRNNFMADLTTASAAAEEGVGGGTHENDTRAWARYTQYCDSVGIDRNYFLDGMPRQHKLAIIGAFAVAIREGRFSRQSDAPLAKNTVSNTVNAVAATFRENGREDPHRDAERHVGRLLQRQLRSYSRNDPKEKQQKALPLCVYRLILASPATELRRSIAELAAATHFWAMRSCEYSKVSRAEKRQTKQLCLRNIVFIKDGNILEHTSTRLNPANCVSITFE